MLRNHFYVGLDIHATIMCLENMTVALKAHLNLKASNQENFSTHTAEPF